MKSFQVSKLKKEIKGRKYMDCFFFRDKTELEMMIESLQHQMKTKEQPGDSWGRQREGAFANGHIQGSATSPGRICSKIFPETF